MKLAHRLLLGALLVVSVLVAVAVVLSGRRLGDQLRQLLSAQLAREARLVGAYWTPEQRPDALADSAGYALGHRVTLIDAAGTVVGDSEFDAAALAALQDHDDRPEVIAARAAGVGHALRFSPSDQVEELYAAVSVGAGRVARVSIGTRELNTIVSRAQGDVFVSGLIALLAALGLAALFTRQVTRPVIELRDVAGAIASGDLSRRPSLSAPGEVGELASAVRRMAEQLDHRMHALEAEDQLLSALVESLNEGVLAVDAARKVIRINGSGRTLLAMHQAVPFPVDLLPRDRALHEAIMDALRGGIVDSAETRIGSRTIALTARPLGVGGAVVALFDLTEIRRLETVRRDFVANVSHELKTPLTVIRGFAETLAAELAPGNAHAQFAVAIKGNADRMQRLVDDLLDLSRIESGGWRPAPVQVDVRAAAEEAAAPFREDMAARRIGFAVEVREDARTLSADPLALRQVLGNLIENAARYTPEDGQVTVRAAREENALALSVQDTGPGIPPEHLPRIFERFYRVDPARSRSAGGTGLGLAIVRHLVEAHGGSVAARSVPNGGTTIEIRFPL